MEEKKEEVIDANKKLDLLITQKKIEREFGTGLEKLVNIHKRKKRDIDIERVIKGREREEMTAEALVLYDQGKWDEAIAMYGKIREEFWKARDIDAMEAWAWWKKRKIVKAAKLWLESLDLGAAPDITNSISFIGLSLIMAEEKNPSAVKYAELSITMLPKGEETIDMSICLSACGIAVAKLEHYEKAEEIFRRTMEINERLEKSDDPKIAKRAKHQRAENGYNLASLVLIPSSGGLDEAIDELQEQVIPRYAEVGAKSDEAAAWHRLGLVEEIQKKYADAGRRYVMPVPESSG